MATPTTNIPGIGAVTAKNLDEQGYSSIEDIAKAEADELAKIHGFGVVRARQVISLAQKIVDANPDGLEVPATTEDSPAENSSKKPNKKKKKSKKKDKGKKNKKAKKEKKSKKKKGKKKKK